MKSGGATLLLLILAAQGCASGRQPAPPMVNVPPITNSPDPPKPRVEIAEEPAWIAASRVPEFRKCAACHRVEKGAAHGLGPNLFGAFGRRAGSAPYYRYSPAMAESGLVWDFATLDRFLAGPRAAVPGTRMAFAGLADPEQRKAVIAFLKLRSEAPRQPSRPAP